ncbi:MAG: hypothetical protein IPM29_13820 [Planctomycetes bacterium]|nr:hypothetical protein [Planctomycetota bacterium]
MRAAQDAGTAAGRAVEAGHDDLLTRIAAEPALLQIILLALLGAALVALWLRARALVRESRRRRALREFLLGVEQVSSEDFGAAARRLGRVVRDDPRHGAARLWHALALLEIGEAPAAHRELVQLRSSDAHVAVRSDVAIAGALLEVGRPAEALEHAVRAVRAAPDAAAAREVLADVQAALAGAEGTTAHAAEPGALVALGAAGDLSLVAAGPLVAMPRRDPAELALVARLDSAARIADALEANPVHVRRLCDALAGGDREALGELAALGARTVPELLARAAAAPGDRRWIEALARLGAEVVPAIVEAWRHADPRGPVRATGVRVLAGVGRALGPVAQPAFAELVETADRELRKAAIDYHVALGDVDAFDGVLDVCSPLEILQRFEEIDASELALFLGALPAGHVLLDVLLAEGAFTRDAVLLAAIGFAADPSPLEALLLRRSPGGDVVRDIVAALADPARAASAGRMLDGLGEAGREQLVAVFADLDRPAEVRSEARRRLLAAGARIVPRLCDGFGAVPGAADRDILGLIVSIGADAIPPLLDAYRAGGVLERFAKPLRRRRTHRRDVIVRALGRIGGPSARRALAELEQRETDADLRLRLMQTLHRIDRPDESSEGGRVGGIA